MTVKLFFNAFIKFLIGIILIGVLLFFPAGSLNYFNGWLFMAVLFIPMFFIGLIMIFKNPKLLQKRLDAKEKQKEQKLVVNLSGLMFIFGFVIAGLNHRFNLHSIPNTVVIIATIIFLVAYILYFEVLRENTYLSRTIKVENNQKVIDKGLYRIVRHPMYFTTLFMFLTIPIILGSIFSLIVFLAYPFIIAKRIISEEKLLEKELNGYVDYKQKVKYRLIPFIW
ncbi:MAG: isoprenylcysteine carboxylmethyltransferase family protein [Ruminococcaceae bacterium]|nr:isoprenylcysteine carboxylmethyltransferase family protein [Oscillospiraceae bacterium]